MRSSWRALQLKRRVVRLPAPAAEVGHVKLRILSLLFWLAPAFAIGCGLFDKKARVSVSVDQTSYGRDEWQRVTVAVRLRNDGDESAVFNGCQLLNKVQVQYCWERLDGGASRGCEEGIVMCAPPTFGRMDLRPGKEYADTLRSVELDPGLYCLRAWYEQAGSESRPRLSEASGPFAVR